jgi:hypothetical protein
MRAPDERGKKPAKPRPKIEVIEREIWQGKGGLSVDARQYRWMDISDSGRPSPKDLYREEAQRRLEAGEVPPTLKEFANELRAWFIAKWPKRKVPAALTIERNIMDLCHRYGRYRRPR